MVMKSSKDIGDMLSSAHGKEKANNRKFLLIILSITRFLARQGLPGHGCGETNSNFIQLLQLQG